MNSHPLTTTSSSPTPTTDCHDLPFSLKPDVLMVIMISMLVVIVIFCFLSCILTCSLCVICCRKKRSSDNGEVKSHWTSVTTPVIFDEEKYPDGTLISQSTSKTFLTNHSVTQEDNTFPITDNSVYNSPYNTTNVDLYGSYDEITDDVFQTTDETIHTIPQSSELPTSISHSYNSESVSPKVASVPITQSTNPLQHTGSMKNHGSVKYSSNNSNNNKIIQEIELKGRINTANNTSNNSKRLHYVEIASTKQVHPIQDPSNDEEPIFDDIYANSSAVRFNALVNKGLSPTSCSFSSNNKISTTAVCPPQTKPKPSGRASISTGTRGTPMVQSRSRFLSHPGPITHVVHHGDEEHIYMSPRPAGVLLPPQDVWKPYKEIEFATLDKESDYAVPSSTQ